MTVNLADLATFVIIENKINNISSLNLEKIQPIIQNSGFAFHVPADGEIVTAFKAIPPTQTFWKTISVFVMFNALEERLSIQIRNGKKIL